MPTRSGKRFHVIAPVSKAVKEPSRSSKKPKKQHSALMARESASEVLEGVDKISADFTITGTVCNRNGGGAPRRATVTSDKGLGNLYGAQRLGLDKIPILFREDIIREQMTPRGLLAPVMRGD